MIVSRMEDMAPKNFQAYVRSIPDVDLDAMLSEIRSRHEAGPRPQKPPWCGECKEDTRLLELGDRAVRCPRCHPLAAGMAADHQSEGGPP